MSSARGSMLAAAALLLSGLAYAAAASANGATPYLPLNLSPEIERKVEQVLILGGEPLLTRPVPIARVMQALPKACERDARLCAEVRHYLDRYFQTAAMTHASIGVAAASKSSDVTLPNAHGETVGSVWDASSVASVRPFDHLLLSVGGVGYGGQDGRLNPDGTLLSLGDEYAQLDAGYRDQWLSPLTDSSMLLSTEAPTMPSLTLSNQMPIGAAGFEYQVFLARMSYENRILWEGNYTAGDPRLFGMHLGFAPLSGWAIAGNATYQFGGGARSASLRDLFDSLFQRTALGTGATATDSRFANRTISITSAYTFPAATPVRTSLEYAARDTLHGELYRFHETALSAGVEIPQLFQRFDLTLELSEWQNGWYTDYVWQNGLIEDGDVIGQWGADWRAFVNAAGGRTGMAQLGFPLRSGDLIDIRLRVLQNAGYAALQGGPAVDYRLAQIATLEYAQPRTGYTRGLTLDAGRDEFGTGIVRLGAFVRFDGGDQGGAGAADSEDSGSGSEEESSEEASPTTARLERFVDVGISGGRLGLDLGGFSRADESAALQYQNVLSPHLGIGLRAAVSAHNDVGVRAEFDNFKGLMLGLRLIDYRYRLSDHFAIGGFAGFARYSAPTPAQGAYFGASLQWLNLWHQWDLSLEDQYFDALQRDKVLLSDQSALQAGGDPVEWYTMQSPSLYLSHRF